MSETAFAAPAPLQRRAPRAAVNEAWLRHLFAAQAVQKAGVLRRAVADVEREVGRPAFIAEVQRRGFHLLEVGGHFLIICQPGAVRMIC